MSGYEAVQRVIREGEERRRENAREHDLAIIRAAHAGAPLTIAGVTYVAAPGQTTTISESEGLREATDEDSLRVAIRNLQKALDDPEHRGWFIEAARIWIRHL